MVATLSFTKSEVSKIVLSLGEYPSLPTPSAYEKARYKIGQSIVTVYTSGKIVIQSPSLEVENAVKEKDGEEKK